MGLRQPINYRILDEGESKDFKYELQGTHSRKLAVFPPITIRSEWVCITGDVIEFKDKFWWDGPSGPTVDTADWMWASLVHDGLYQLGKSGELFAQAIQDLHGDKRRVKRYTRKLRRAADDELLAILRAEGMPWWRRAYSWAAVRIGGPRFHKRRWHK